MKKEGTKSGQGMFECARTRGVRDVSFHARSSRSHVSTFLRVEFPFLFERLNTTRRYH